MDWHKEVLENLKDYPNSFQLEEFVQPRRQRCAAAVRKSMKETFDTSFEEIRNENFVSLLLFKLANENHVEDALEMNAKVLSKDPKNIVALANQVYLYKYIGREGEARGTQEKLELIKQSEEFSLRHDEALGEIAYSYTRMGPKFYHKAINKFKDVLKRRPDEYLLKFGLALTYRRCLTQCIFSLTPTENVGAALTSAVNQLQDIVLYPSNPPHLKAKAYIELGDFYKMMDDCRFPLNSVLISQLDIKRIMDVTECYTKAYKTSGNNRFVLERTGRYFCNIRMDALSETLLKRAIEVHPESTFAHHHLALLYMDIANDKNINSTADSEDLWHKAEDHLNQSLSISNGSNNGAVYDLGILCICISKHQKAIKQFRKIIEKGHPFASPLERVNAYEQLGLLYRQMSNDEQFTMTQQHEYQTECKIMLTKSIEEAAKAVVRIPGLKTSELLVSWKALPTLEELLFLNIQESEDVNTMMEVARLRRLMCQYRSSLDLYTQIHSSGSDGSCSVDVMEGKIENYLQLQDFDNAVLTLYLLQSTQPRNHDDRRRDFDKNIFLTCGMQFLKQQQLEKAGECFRSSFRTVYPSSSTREYVFDIFILDDREEIQNKELDSLKQCLEYCGLKVTQNDHSVKPGRFLLTGQLNIMEESKVIIIFLTEEKIQNELEYFCNTAIGMLTGESGPSNIVIVKTYAEEEPLLLRSFTSIEYRDCQSQQHLDEDDTKWLRGLLHALLRK